jgi:hypothetical protein
MTPDDLQFQDQPQPTFTTQPTAFYAKEYNLPAGEYLLDFPLDSRDTQIASMCFQPSAGVWYHHWRKFTP